MGMRRVAALLVLGVAGCTLRIPQPEMPPGPTVTVYLIAEEGHSGLLFPADDGGWTEYGFGDYSWYVHGRGDGGWAMYTAMAASSGALARRSVGAAPLEDPWSIARGWVLYPYTVSKASADALQADLEAEFRAGGQPVFNPLFGFYCVRADAPYSMWFNCTDAVAVWLERLDVPSSTRGISSHLLGPSLSGIAPGGVSVR